jgi:3-methyladenine DNA glycosylase AlkD
VQVPAKRILALRREIRDWCASQADPKQVAKYARYFREGYDAWGIHDGDEWIAQKRQWLTAYSDLGLSGFLELGTLLFSTGKYEEAAAGIWLVAQFKREFKKSTLAAIAKWFPAGVRNWAHTDVICAELLGYIVETGIAGLEDFGRWRTSDQKFQRRAVPVTMIALLKKTDDYGPLLDFLRPMMLDEERVVQQGLGWFLREAWKRQRLVVEEFLIEFKDTAPRLIYQYATEKMTPEQKNRFRRAKAARSTGSS